MSDEKCEFDGGSHIWVWAYDSVYSCQLCFKAIEKELK